MESETKTHSTSSVSANCQNCQKDFTIEPEDFSFYEKMKVPSPTWCPECRMIRRLASVNGWSLFYRNCDKCGKRTLSMYPPDREASAVRAGPPSQKITVYCQPCWWSDSWDGTEYAMDYDLSRPFLAQWRELSEQTPYVALESTYLNLKNCDYSNALAYSKNCTLVIWADYSENTYFSSFLFYVKDTADSLRIFNSELCYESIGQDKAYRVFYSQECESCVDVWFSRNCYSCTNCIGCVNLRGASNYIFNMKYSKEEYAKKLKELKLDTRSGIDVFKKEAEIFWKKFPHRFFTGNSLNLNVTGEYVYESKNSKEMYNVGSAENCKWCQFITFPTAKDCWDYSGWGNNSELVYDSGQVGENVSNVKFSVSCFPDVVNIEYCQWCISPKNNFGCVNLKRKSYSILNKQYSKEEYKKLRAEIITQMKKEGIYGDFFPKEISAFGYNESSAIDEFPLTKEEALRQGFKWEDTERGVYDKETINWKIFPDSIIDLSESFNANKEVFKCIECGKNYRIIINELTFYKRMKIPIPRNCPECRHVRRFKNRGPNKLWHRQCMCGSAGSPSTTTNHLHGTKKCEIEFETSYAPDRPEIIYCEKCYQQEVY